MPSWADRLVPAAPSADAETLRRARLTVLLSAVLIGTALTYAVFYGAVVRFPAGAVLTGGGGAGAAAALAVFGARSSFRALGHTLTCVFYAVLVGLVSQTGGLPSPVTPWLAMPPMFAALLLGRRGAAGWAALGVLTIVALYAATIAGARFPVGYAAAWATPVTFASYAGLVGCSAVLLFVFEDIRAAAQARAEAASAALARMAYHDALTGLSNRARFLERLGAALARARAAGDPARVAVLLLDLDGFKGVNDSLGHAAGDTVLAEVAARLLNATRGCDTVARLGGDEFAVLLEVAREDAAAVVVAERILAALAAPFVLDGRQARVGASVGIARSAAGADARAGSDAAVDVGTAGDAQAPRGDVAAVMRAADVAMYRAKALGKGRWVWFEAEMEGAPLQAPAAPVAPLDLRGGPFPGPFGAASPAC
jgi:diguanylate cyclase (GGDEF)-like protein